MIISPGHESLEAEGDAGIFTPKHVSLATKFLPLQTSPVAWCLTHSLTNSAQYQLVLYRKSAHQNRTHPCLHGIAM